jgi:hypothetical protein
MITVAPTEDAVVSLHVVKEEQILLFDRMEAAAARHR